MAVVLLLGLWLAFGPASRPTFNTREGAITQDIRLGDTRGVLESFQDASTGTRQFRVFMRMHEPTRTYTDAEVRELFGEAVYQNAITPRSNWVFHWLNITSWSNVVWVGIGFFGQLAFSGRMLLQWITSERRRESVITESFWWFSLVGSVTLFSYFVWRQDPVAILGQASGVVIYARNIRLIYKRRRREMRRSAG